MTTRISFEAKSGNKVDGELAEPAGGESGGKAPAVVLVQEWWGVNDHVRDVATRLAAEGFVVLAPDLYHGKTTKDADEAGKLMNALDGAAAVDEIAGAVTHLASHPRSNGKVGIVGFCMGGALSLASACHVTGLSAVVAYYGLPAPEKVDYAKVTAPILMHVGKHDAWVSPEKAKALEAELASKGKAIQLEIYDADHAFSNDTRPEVYSADNAKLAWERTIAFFKKHLA